MGVCVRRPGFDMDLNAHRGVSFLSGPNRRPQARFITVNGSNTG